MRHPNARHPLVLHPQLTSSPQELPAIEPGVALWWCALERTPAEISGIASVLSPAEMARAARFGTDALRHRWMAGRSALRIVLGRTLGIDPAAVAIVRGVRGRPELADSVRAHRLQRLAYPQRRVDGASRATCRDACASASTSSTAIARSASDASRGNS